MEQIDQSRLLKKSPTFAPESADARQLLIQIIFLMLKKIANLDHHPKAILFISFRDMTASPTLLFDWFIAIGAALKKLGREGCFQAC
jgi:hypothetical protein